MSFTRISALAAIAAFVVPAAATAAAADRAPAAETSNGIIAILIGQAKADPFTPPIGTDKGSVVGRRVVD